MWRWWMIWVYLTPFVLARDKKTCHLTYRAIFIWPWKMVSVSVCYLFYQPMDEKNKTWTPRFPAKENPNMEKALFDWPILLQYDVKAISRKFFGHEVFSAERSVNQPKPRRVCIRSINQSNRCISVCLLFLFCSRVFISRSYENRSNKSFTGQACSSKIRPWFLWVFCVEFHKNSRKKKRTTTTNEANTGPRRRGY